MQGLVWVASVLLVAVLARVGGRKDRLQGGSSKQSMQRQLCNGACAISLRAIHLGVSIHRAFQAWVQSSLSQAGLDVRELLEGDDNELVAEKRQQIADLLSSLPQRPAHLAVVLPDSREDIINDVEVLCASALLAKVPRLTIYTRDTSMKDSADAISSRLCKSKMAARAFGSTPRIDLDIGSKRAGCSSGDTGGMLDERKRGGKPDICVSLWSRNNGYPALSALARELAGQARNGALRARQVDEAFVADRLADPLGHCHPDLVILVDDLACLPEFPPWQLQNAEMVQVSSSSTADGSLGRITFGSLARYAKVSRRWGR
ncbi:hypothetical protein GGI11_002034 [Coemansia sp. RSA 2049]|nr:hypothetical protein GGI11_002034 [Coemansia sp. RSA 2049]KAJ2604442.1 hypothetical protein EV177_006412 [Coemansia sp. RSA 1804]KAJ2691734.1 hypothetical protein GGH99_002205 [Coemansia sp. RSA 1285]